jgi:DNA-binding transcriptional LysR family regulator
MDKLKDLRAGDLMIFLSVARCQSVNGAGRELNLPASQVSKAIARLEVQLGTSLMVRSTRGITISDAGARMLPQLEELVKCVENLDRREALHAPIAVAAPSYMIASCARHLAAALPAARIRAIEMAPPLIRTLAAGNFFDVCVTLSADRLPTTWSITQVGEMRRALFASPRFAQRLGATRGPVPLEVLREHPFVLPVYIANGVYVPVDDGCPVPAAHRVPGHEAQTIALGLELATVTDQLVYGPVMAAYPFLASGRVVEIEVDGWQDTRPDPVFVACNVDRVRAPDQRRITDAMREMFTIRTPS